MQVRVKLMGTLRSQLPPGGSGAVEAEPGTTVAALLARLGIDGVRIHLVMVNGEMATDRQRVLADGDDVTVFPPVAGGQKD